MASSIEHVLEPLPVREPLGAVDVPERHRADDAVSEPEDVVVQRHRRRARAAEVGDEPAHLLLAREPRGLDAAHAEELDDEELARLAPLPRRRARRPRP
jgi:hypothetical protein